MLRFIKGVLKYLLWVSMITIICGIIFFFINSPFLYKYEERALCILFIVILFPVGIALIGLLKGGIKSLKIKDRSSSLLILLISITCFFTVFTTIIFNNAISQTVASLHNQNSASISQKVDMIRVVIRETMNEYKIEPLITNMQSKNYEHITFYYSPENGNEEERLVDGIIDKITSLDKMIDPIIPTMDSHPVKVILHNDIDKYMKVTKTPRDMLRIGFFHKDIISLVNVQVGRQLTGQKKFSTLDVENTFIHEYFHYKFNAYLTENQLDALHIPRWFEEGLATYCPYALRDAFPILKFPNFDIRLNDLVTFDQWENHADSTVYSYAYMAIYYLIDMSGEDAIHNILDLLKKDILFDEAFEIEIGLTVDEFENQISS